ncbi:hypothetical protein E0L36_26970 [Streptomyces sp. AJS327]|uniref:hypothetical protein n=1 Tax=Streptomyces sp. AJS327 TaxID=2545265 RepID=UPI0015DE12B6|nr:hypothetical protein [Streptomyces sp. AJS327]MBA0049756.1 hypothetical protein [Streptomyces sp. AJS327]MBA0054358.1 hypothetical protein [Streptomyces sp. AJS327]
MSIPAIYDSLPAQTRSCWRALSHLPGPVLDLEEVAAACGLPIPDARHLVEALVGAGLLKEGPSHVTPAPTVRFDAEMRDLARAAASRDDLPVDREVALRRWVEGIVAITTAAERVLSPWHLRLSRDLRHMPPDPPPFGADPTGAVEWLARHEATVMAALTVAEAQGWHSLAWQVVHAAWPHWHRAKPVPVAIDAHERGLAAARAAGDRCAVREMLTSLAGMLRAGRAYDQAWECALEARDSAHVDGDVRAEAQATHQAGSVALESATRVAGLDPAARVRVAREYFVKALSLRERLHQEASSEEEGFLYQRQCSLTRIQLGQVELHLGSPDTAIKVLSRAHADLTSLGDSLDAARALTWLAWAHAVRASDPTPALHLLERAKAAFHAASARSWIVRVEEVRGDIHHRHEQWDLAAEAYSEAQRLLDLFPDSFSTEDAQRIGGLLKSLPEN